MDPTFKGFSAPTPVTQKRGGLNWRMGLLIAGGLTGLIIIVSVIAGLLSPNTTNTSQRLLYRMDTLATLVTSARSNIHDDALGKINADLSIMLLGDSASLKKLITTAKTTPELTAIKKEESDTATTDKLKTALVNGAYDTTYRTILVAKLEAAATLIKDLHSKTSSKALKQALVTASDHINTYYQQLKKLP